MNVLLKSVIDRMNDGSPEANAFKAAISSRLYANAAPQDTPFPYVVMTIVSDIFEETFTSDMENIVFQFSIFSNNSSSEEAGDIFELLKAVYDDTELTVAGYKNFRVVRLENRLEREPDDAWQYIVDYRINLYKL